MKRNEMFLRDKKLVFEIMLTSYSYGIVLVKLIGTASPDI